MRALILGVNGQDGSYLAQLLLKRGYEVIGSSRNIETSSLINLKLLGIDKDITKISLITNNSEDMIKVLKNYKPDEIYNLAGASSVAFSFVNPMETIKSIIDATLVILEAIRYTEQPISLYNASSGECYGFNNGIPSNEKNLFKPCSPYGVAKAAAHNLVENYRKSYGIKALNGILFNHESPLRGKNFVTQKIVKAALEIKKGKQKVLNLGNINISRDWGWAPDYVLAMWLMLQSEKTEDYIIATGRMNSLKDFIKNVFLYFDLDWKKHVCIENQLYRPNEIILNCGDSSLAKKNLNWEPKIKFHQIVKNMCEAIENEDNFNHAKYIK